MGKQLDTEAQLVVQVAALAMMCEQLKRERDEARHEVVSTLAAHVTDGLYRLNRLDAVPGPGLIEAAEELLSRGPA